jgi:hypothetical protein
MQVDSEDTRTTTTSSNITIEIIKNNNEDELSFASFYYSFKLVLKVSKG